MGYNYRCSKSECRKRITLKKPIEFYVWKKKRLCPGCGQSSLRSCWVKEMARTRRRMCFCRGNRWPHNKGRVQDENLWCIHSPDPQGILWAKELGFDTKIMKPDDPVPF